MDSAEIFETLLRKNNELLCANISEKVKAEIQKLAVDFSTKFEIQNTVNMQVEKRLGALEDSVQRLQKKSQLIFQGIPAVSDEKPTEIVSSIASVIGYLPKHGFIAYRMKSKADQSIKTRLRPKARGDCDSAKVYPASILVTFSSPLDKLDFISKYLDYVEPLKLSHIPGFSSDTRIFIRENLTQVNLAIFRKCAELKKNNKISKYYTRNGLCYIKIGTHDKALAVTELKYLSNFK